MKLKKPKFDPIVFGDEKTGLGFLFPNDVTRLPVNVIESLIGKVPLIAADPPYGKIVSEEWDRRKESQGQFTDWMLKWVRSWSELALPGGSFYLWGGVGKPKYRPLYEFLARVEVETDLLVQNHVTWAKKRAYGVQNNYLFTREELIWLLTPGKQQPWNVQLLEEKRNYAGFNPKYPAKSEFKRRTNVWTDITELFSGKVHSCQKPEKLYEVLIDGHTKSGDWVVDLFGGSGAAAFAAHKMGRNWLMVENGVEEVKSFTERYKERFG